MTALLGPKALGPETRAALELARRAGREIAMPALSVGKHVTEDYKGPRELVTEVDRNIERFLAAELKERFEYPFYGEEEVQEGEAGGTRWIVDPLDGTTNFVHGHPFFAVSIALEREGVLEVGVIHAPYLDETFFAERGKGAYFNTERIRLSVTDTDDPMKALVATGFAYDRERYPNVENWVAIQDRVRGVRRCGAAAIDMAYVACGRYDGFWELGLAPYDVAAGAVLVREAGGRVTDLAGGEDWLEGRSMLATNGPLHEPLKSLVLHPRGRD